MAEAKQREAWAHTSTVMALVANVNRARKSRTFKPSDFDPFAAQRHQQGEPVPGSVSMLKDVFVKRKEA